MTKHTFENKKGCQIIPYLISTNKIQERINMFPKKYTLLPK